MHTKALRAGLSTAAAATASYRQLYQGIGNTTWMENLRVRANGHVLTTVIGPPANLLSFDPSAPNPAPVVVSTFPSVVGLSGITEVTPDVFIITGSNFTGATVDDPPVNTNHIWKVDFNNNSSNATDQQPTIELIAEPVLPLVTVFNGATTYNASLILAAAPYDDAVVALDVNTGAYWTAFEKIPEMVSINGIKVDHAAGYLYWTAPDYGVVRAPLSLDTWGPLGAAQVLHNATYDDLAVSPVTTTTTTKGTNGTVTSTKVLYMADWDVDGIQQLVLDEATGAVLSATIVAEATGNGTTWGHPTGCDFGRTAAQRNKIYCNAGTSETSTADAGLGGQLFEITL